MQRVQEFANQRPRAAALYACFIGGCIIVAYTLETKPSGQYDYVLTLAAALQAMGFAILVLDTSSQVAQGLSEKTLWAFFIAHVARLSTTFWGEGYVPEDNTGDVYLYQCLEVASVLLLFVKLLGMKTVRTMHDVGQENETWITLGAMVAIALALGYVTQSTGHEDFLADWSWMFSVWLDSIALVPQVRMLLASTLAVDEGTFHFAMLTLAASASFTFFWLRTAREHWDKWMADGYHLFTFGIVGAGIVRTGLCSVYVYSFARSAGGKGWALGKSEYELCVQDDEL